ncbi:MAG: hypothetical protein WCL21_18605 [Mariniphaga sp.]
MESENTAKCRNGPYRGHARGDPPLLYNARGDPALMHKARGDPGIYRHARDNPTCKKLLIKLLIDMKKLKGEWYG